MTPEPKVFIVDDDEAVRDSLDILLRAAGFATAPYPDAEAFLAADCADAPGCLLLDVRMPGLSGLELQEKLVERQAMLPIIFITGHGEVDMAVHAMRAGAVDFLQKPFTDEALLTSVRSALERDRESRASLERQHEIAERKGRLTPREAEVMERIVRGEANKVVAIDLGLSERTVEIHRSRVMKKMEATSLPHLVRLVLMSRD